MLPEIAAVTNRFGTSHRNLLVFRLGAQVFAIAIEYVVQIIPMLQLTPLPYADPSIQGVANIRGTIVPIINVRCRLGFPHIAPKLQTPIILIRFSNHFMGLLVDEVIDVLSLPANQVAKPEIILPKGVESSPVLEGIVLMDRHTILLIDPQVLVSDANIQSQLDSAMAAFPDLQKPGDAAAAEPPLKTTPTPQPLKRKPRRSRTTKTERVLASQIATLAEDIPPVNGEIDTALPAQQNAEAAPRETSENPDGGGAA